MNKFFLGIIFSTIIFYNSSAQNYKLFQHDSLRLYQVPGNSLIHGLFMDSVSTQGQDTTYYNYGTVGFNGSNGCLITNQPIFIGKKVLMKSDGTTVLFNLQEDSIFLQPNAQPGDSWEMYRFANGDRVIAYMYPTYTYSILNAIDSVNNIVMNVVDSTGATVVNPLNSKSIKISKEHGIFLATDFNIFPYSYSEYRLKNKRMMTRRDFFSYLPGDTIQTTSQCHIGSNYGPISYSTTIICDVYYSAGGDTMFYKNSCSQGYTYLTNLDDPVIEGYPGRLINNDCHYFELYYGFNCDSTALTIEETSYTGSYVGSDSCYYDLFEPEINSNVYNEGTGTMLSFHTDAPINYPNIYSCGEGIRFYRHGTLHCGSYFNTTLDVEAPEITSQKLPLIFSPNPVTTSIQFVRSENTALANEIFIEICDITGKMLITKYIPATDQSIEFDISEYLSGLYFFSAKSVNQIIQNGTFIKAD